jgi:hypothetical protein
MIMTWVAVVAPLVLLYPGWALTATPVRMSRSDWHRTA